MLNVNNDGQRINFSLGPNKNLTFNNLISGASTIIINTNSGSKITHIIPPGASIEIFAGNEILNIECDSFTPCFEKLKSI